MSFLRRLFTIHTLKSLSALDDHLLCDLGLSRQDLFEARHAHGEAARFLHDRAAERAASWIH